MRYVTVWCKAYKYISVISIPCECQHATGAILTVNRNNTVHLLLEYYVFFVGLLTVNRITGPEARTVPNKPGPINRKKKKKNFFFALHSVNRFSPIPLLICFSLFRQKCAMVTLQKCIHSFYPNNPIRRCHVPKR